MNPKLRVEIHKNGQPVGKLYSSHRGTMQVYSLRFIASGAKESQFNLRSIKVRMARFIGAHKLLYHPFA